MNDITALAQRMKAAAEKATTLNLDTALGIRDEDGCIECPACGGEGYVDAERDYCNIDNVALGVQFYGIGEHHGLAEEYFRQVAPANVLALVEALEKAQKSNEFLKDQLSELANFNPDWDKLEASYESWREIAAELLVAKERIAELESFRTAFTEWSDKTEWMRGDKRFDALKPWGKHQADVLKAYIEHLESRTVTVKLPPRIDNIDLRSPLEVEDMWIYRLKNALTTAGIQVIEGEA